MRNEDDILNELPQTPKKINLVWATNTGYVLQAVEDSVVYHYLWDGHSRSYNKEVIYRMVK